jgi:hypothetical protein
MNGKGKAVPITGHGVPLGCEMSRLLHFLGNRLTDGGEVGNLCVNHPLPPPAQEIPGTHFW